MKHTMQILGMTAITFLASCTQKDKNPEIDITAKTDPMAIQAPVDSINTDTSAKGDTSENALDWSGTYKAVVPCADCPGIKTELTLNKDKTFRLSEEYLERSVKNQDQGTFQWDSSGKTITLKGKNSNSKYKVGENTLTQLDTSGQPMEGPNKNLYVFKKK